MHLACGLTDLAPVALHLALPTLYHSHQRPTQASFGPERAGRCVDKGPGSQGESQMLVPEHAGRYVDEGPGSQGERQMLVH